MQIKLILRVAVVAMLFTAASGCATYAYKFQPIERALVAHHPDVALTALDSAYSPSGVDAPLYFLNKGMLLRLNNRFADSNDALESARRLIEKVEAVSVTEQTSAFLVNDTTHSYEGEDFEKVLLHLYKALNYLDLQQPNEARVEAQQIDVKIRELNGSSSGGALTEEAFARYLTGIIYENLGEWSDAMIDYRKAYEAFGLYKKKYNVALPASLKYALLRLTERQGLSDELKSFREEFKITDWPSVASREVNGEFILTLHSGLVALKGEVASHALDPSSGRLIRVALPVYHPRTVQVTQARLHIGDQTVQLDLVEDVTALAIKSLESHMVAITARTVARAAVKYRVAKEAEKRNPGAGLLMNIAGVVLEQADTRSWSSLPAQIQLGRVSLPPGTYKAQLELLDNSGKLINTRDFGNVAITRGKATYLAFHWTS
jgi:hypothetical protein